MNTSARGSSKASVFVSGSSTSTGEDLAATLFILRLSCASCLHPGTLFAPRRLEDPEGAARVGTRATTPSDTTVAISHSKRVYACRAECPWPRRQENKICSEDPAPSRQDRLLLHSRGRRGRTGAICPNSPRPSRRSRGQQYRRADERSMRRRGMLMTYHGRLRWGWTGTRRPRLAGIWSASPEAATSAATPIACSAAIPGTPASLG